MLPKYDVNDDIFANGRECRLCFYYGNQCMFLTMKTSVFKRHFSLSWYDFTEFTLDVFILILSRELD